MDRLISHGSTVATNIVVERKGANIGLITTRGFEDTIRTMRGLGRPTGEPPENLLRFAETRKPEPLVPIERTFGVAERIDSDGDVVVALDEEAVAAAADSLLAAGVDTIAIAFLWSFSIVEKVARNVKRWRAGNHALRWTATGLLEAEKKFRRVKGYRELELLQSKLNPSLTQQVQVA